MARYVDGHKLGPKLHDRELFDMLEEHNNGFVDYYRSHIQRNGKKYYGTVFKLEKPLTDDLKEILTKYSNVRLFKGHAQYAPEIKFAYVMLLDQRIAEWETFNGNIKNYGL